MAVKARSRVCVHAAASVLPLRVHAQPQTEPLVTPDGRYIVVRGRLWRRTNPELAEAERERQVHALMTARRDVQSARRAADRAAESAARRRVHLAKVALGERGPVWWTDGAPDYTRKLAKNTPYTRWFAALGE